MTQPLNLDPQELDKFESSAHKWWDKTGDYKPLHDINPLRADYIDEKVGLAGSRVLDVGCGGGLLSEEMAKRGAEVLGIDAGANVIGVAQLHQMESQVDAQYAQMTAEQLLAENPRKFDVVTCLEILEHVPEPGVLVDTCSQLVRRGGHVFFSTINRTAKAYALGIVGAEYVLRLLPKGTHDYKKLIRPSELAYWARQASLEVRALDGIAYNPFTGHARLTRNVDINYLMWTQA